MTSRFGLMDLWNFVSQPMCCIWMRELVRVCQNLWWLLCAANFADAFLVVPHWANIGNPDPRTAVIMLSMTCNCAGQPFKALRQSWTWETLPFKIRATFVAKHRFVFFQKEASWNQTILRWILFLSPQLFRQKHEKKTGMFFPSWIITWTFCCVLIDKCLKTNHMFRWHCKLSKQWLVYMYTLHVHTAFETLGSSSKKGGWIKSEHKYFSFCWFGDPFVDIDCLKVSRRPEKLKHVLRRNTVVGDECIVRLRWSSTQRVCPWCVQSTKGRVPWPKVATF